METIKLLYSMLENTKSHNRDRETLKVIYVKERLNKSLVTYMQEIEKMRFKHTDV